MEAHEVPYTEDGGLVAPPLSTSLFISCQGALERILLQLVRIAAALSRLRSRQISKARTSFWH